MIRFIQFLLLLNVSAQISSKPLTTSNAQKSLLNFLTDGINYQSSPCDNFYDYVCGVSRSSSSSLVRLYDEFIPKLVEAIRSDEKYPKISESYLAHADKCVQFRTNDSNKFNAIHKYLKGFGFQPFLQEEANNEKNYMETLLKLIFLSPAIFPKPGMHSPIDIEYDFDPIDNTFMLYAAPGSFLISLPPQDAMPEDATFGGYFDKAWTLYQNFLLKYDYIPEHITTMAERDEVVDFIDDYLSLIAKSRKEFSTTKKLHNIENTHLQKAINKLLPQHMDETVHMGNLYVSLDEKLFEELDSLFQSRPQQGQHFILSMALLSISYSIGPVVDNEIILKDATTRNCYLYYPLNPRKSGAIFNLYAADLVIRNNFPMTSVEDKFQVRSLAEKLQAVISRSLMSTTFLKGSRELIIALDLLSGITKHVGLPEEVYDRKNFDTELARFSGFSPEDDFIDEVIKLRSSNFRLRNRWLSSDKTYFTFKPYFNALKNSLYVDFLALQSPFFDSSYPSSYVMGSIGTIIGHEFFHRFAPPHEQKSWMQEPEFRKSLDCYTIFFNEKICYDVDLRLSENEPLTRICAAEYKDPHEENIPDVEGTRVAFQALKDIYGAKLKTKAVPELVKFTHEQLFFVAYAQRLCDKRMNDDIEFALQFTDKDPHAVNKVRVNAVVMQMSEFATAFNCKASDSMVLPEEDRCYMLPTTQA